MPRSIKQLRSTIKSIGNTKKTTKTMQLISATRLQKISRLAVHAKLYEADLAAIAATIPAVSAPETQLTTKKMLLLITTDRGLCGGFVAEAIRKTQSSITDTAEVLAIGSKGAKLCNSNQLFRLHSLYPVLGKDNHLLQIQSIVQVITPLLASYELLLGYYRYSSPLNQQFVIESLVPKTTAPDTNSDFLIEPDLETVTQEIKNRYLQYRIYSAMLQTSLSEHYARMTAMQSATDAATDIISSLSLELNKTRQQTITQELSQIVSASTLTI